MSDLIITEPGVYDMPLDDYLADPVRGGSLSASGAKTILNQSPAHYAYEREHGRPGKHAFDIGHAAHAEILGAGPRIAVIPDDILSSNGSTNTKAAQAFIAAAREDGAVPIKSDDAAAVKAMGDALRAHPRAARLLSPDRGTAEQSIVWRDERTGVNCRARFDLLPHPTSARMLCVDYKTTTNAKPDRFAKDIHNFDYHVQGAHYLNGAVALGLADQDAAWLLVAQERTPPYLVSIVQLSTPTLQIGRERVARAFDIYAECTASGVWPGYSTDVQVVDLPAWAEAQHDREMAAA